MQLRCTEYILNKKLYYVNNIDKAFYISVVPAAFDRGLDSG